MYRLSGQPVPDSMVPTAASVLEKPIISQDGHQFILCEQKFETAGASAIIFVIARSDLNADLQTLRTFLDTNVQKSIPLLILVSKQDTFEKEDLDSVCTEITPLIGSSRSWIVWGCSGRKNTGLVEALEWLQMKLALSS